MDFFLIWNAIHSYKTHFFIRPSGNVIATNEQ